jgi:hypothetical protein
VELTYRSDACALARTLPHTQPRYDDVVNHRRWSPPRRRRSPSPRRRRSRSREDGEIRRCVHRSLLPTSARPRGTHASLPRLCSHSSRSRTPERSRWGDDRNTTASFGRRPSPTPAVGRGQPPLSDWICPRDRCARMTVRVNAMDSLRARSLCAGRSTSHVETPASPAALLVAQTHCLLFLAWM